jgi:hypothetical protein
MIEVPRFEKASEAANWLANNITKKNWTQAAFAKGPYGATVPVEHPDAQKFCAIGWIRKVDQGYEQTLIDELEMYLKNNLEDNGFYDNYNEDIAEWNDDEGREYVELADAFLDISQRLEKEGQ